MTGTLVASTGPAAAPLVRRRRTRRFKEAALGYLFVLPALVVFGSFVYFPFAKTIRQSFFRTNPFDPTQETFAGTEIYEQVLDPAALVRALGFGIPVGIGVGAVLVLLTVGLARLTGRPITGRTWFRTSLGCVGGAIVVASICRYSGIGVEATTDTRFANSLGVTLQFVIMTVPTGLVLGLALAVLAHQQCRGIGIYRTIFSSTVVSSVAVTSVIFFTLLNPIIGLVPYWLGVQGQSPILTNPTWALPAVAVASIWQSLGLSFIVMSAGLQSVPDDLLEAAAVDGAGSIRRFWSVTLPMLSPTVFFAAVVGLIFAFQTFGQIDILTQGGPNYRTDVIVYAIKSTAVTQSPNYGAAAVMAIALFVITLGVTGMQLKFVERRVSYDR